MVRGVGIIGRIGESGAATDWIPAAAVVLIVDKCYRIAVRPIRNNRRNQTIANVSRVVVRIRSVLNMDVSVACLFQNPTIETLAAAMDWMRSSKNNHEDVLRLLEEIEAMPASIAEGN